MVDARVLCVRCHIRMSEKIQYGTLCVFFFQAEDGIRDLVRSRGLGDVYKRQELIRRRAPWKTKEAVELATLEWVAWFNNHRLLEPCLLYTSDAADERSSVDLGGRRIIKKKTTPIIL